MIYLEMRLRKEVKHKLSIIVPVYYNAMNLPILYDDLKEKVLTKLDCGYEIVMVDDGSQDNSYQIICELARKDTNIKPVKLSRNFGSHAAMLAGLSVCSGDCAMIKAADLQEPSEMILDMYSSWKNGNDVVLAVRKDREEGVLQTFLANTYYHIMGKIALPNMPHGGFDCFLIDRKVMNVLIKMEEKNTTLMGQVLWSGFKTDKIYYIRKAREVGKSRWTLSKKIKLVVDSIVGFSFFPIRLISFVGVIFFISSIVTSLYVLFNKFFVGIPVQGWTTLVLLNLFSSGIIMLTLGVIGEYIWRTFDATRNRPPFIIEEIWDDANDKKQQE